MRKFLLVFFALIAGGPQGLAQSPHDERVGCVNEECKPAAEGLGAATVLLGLTMSPLILKSVGAIPGFDRHFLPSPVEINVGFGRSNARLARMLVDASDLEGTDWGFFTRLEMIAPPVEKTTELRFQAGPQLTIVKSERFRLGIATGLSATRILELTEAYGGIPVSLNLTHDLSARWRIHSQVAGLFYKKAVKRAAVQLWHDGSGMNVGYEFEDSRLTETHSHFLTLGFSAI